MRGVDVHPSHRPLFFFVSGILWFAIVIIILALVELTIAITAITAITYLLLLRSVQLERTSLNGTARVTATTYHTPEYIKYLYPAERVTCRGSAVLRHQGLFPLALFLVSDLDSSCVRIVHASHSLAPGLGISDVQTLPYLLIYSSILFSCSCRRRILFIYLYYYLLFFI